MGSFVTKGSEFVYQTGNEERVLLDVGDYFSNKGRIPFHSDLTDVTVPSMIVSMMDAHASFCHTAEQADRLPYYTMLDVMLVREHIKSKHPKRVLELGGDDDVLKNHWTFLLKKLHPDSVFEQKQETDTAEETYDITIINGSTGIQDVDGTVAAAMRATRQGGMILCFAVRQPALEQAFYNVFQSVGRYNLQEDVAVLRADDLFADKNTAPSAEASAPAVSKRYDTLIMTTPTDYLRLRSLYPRIASGIPDGKIVFVGNAEVVRLVRDDFETSPIEIGAIDENEILPFGDVHKRMTEKMAPILQGRELPRGITGWYYQQFLKWEYAKQCKDEYYLVWDGDTIPCRKLTMFKNGTTQPYLDLKHEHHPPYFETIGRILPGMKKVIGRSFISEHMLINKDICMDLIQSIESNDTLSGTAFWEKILDAIPTERIQDSAFSEFETYGTFVALRHPSAYLLREWHSFRLGGEFFDPETISDRDFTWLGHDFDAISFEKGMSVREDHRNLFDNPHYQEKLTARQMLEAAQKEFQDGYIEVWGDSGSADGDTANVKQGGFEDHTEDTAREKLRDLPADSWKSYEALGDSLADVNRNQAYLCYENAAFLCEENDNEKKRLEQKAGLLRSSGDVNVNRVAIVILSYNNTYLMQKCIHSIRCHCNPETCEIVVLDNASTDGVTDWLKKQDDITLLLRDENLGFPAGCNEAIRSVNGDFDVFLLNNDTRMAPNALFWLRMALYDREDTGATGSITNYAAEHQRVDIEFSYPEQYVAYGAKVNVPPLQAEKSNVLSGFALLIKRAVLDQVGLFDEAFSPGYLEDTDLCLRIRKAGYRLMLCRNSFIYHAGSQSFMSRGDTEKLFDRNFEYLREKWGSDMIEDML